MSSTSNTFDIVVIMGWDPIKTKVLHPSMNVKWGKLFLVGNKYADVDKRSLASNTVIIPYEPGYIFRHSRFNQEANDLGYQTKTPPHTEMIKYLKDTPATVAYLCFDRSIARDIFELASLSKTERLTKRFWYVGPPVESPYIEEIPDLINGSEDLVDIKAKMSAESQESMKKFMTQGINHLRMFIHAGYEYRESLMPVDGWVLNVASPWNSLIISMNKIKPTFIDSNIERELFDNSKIRKALTDRTLFTLSNYFTVVFFGGKIPYDPEGGDLIPSSSEDTADSRSAEDVLYKKWTDIGLWNFIFREYSESSNF